MQPATFTPDVITLIDQAQTFLFQGWGWGGGGDGEQRLQEVKPFWFKAHLERHTLIRLYLFSL